MLKLKGNDNLDQFALDAAFGRKKESPRQLHRQRGTTLDKTTSRRQIVAQCAQNANVVHSAVIKKAPVLNCHYRMHQVRRNLVVVDQASFRAVGVAQVGDEQRFKIIARQLVPVAVDNRTHHTGIEIDRSRVFGMERLWPRVYRDTLCAFGIRAHGGSLRSPARRVAGLSQFARNQVCSELLSGPYLSRRSINLGRFGKQRPLQARVDNPLVLEVVKVENDKGCHRQRCYAHKRDAHRQHCPRVFACGSGQPDFQRQCHSIHLGNHKPQTIKNQRWVPHVSFLRHGKPPISNHQQQRIFLDGGTLGAPCLVSETWETTNLKPSTAAHPPRRRYAGCPMSRF